MARTKLGVGVIGTGWVSGEHIKAFANNPHCEIRAICSRKMETARARIASTGQVRAEPFDDVGRMLEHGGIDIVTICTPHPFHPEQAIAAAEAGKHLLIEKPVALDVDNLRKMRDAVRKAKVRTAVCFELRWNPLFQVIRDLLARKMVGRLFYGEVDYFHGIGPWYGQYEWNRLKDMGGSDLLTAGCHAVDGLRWFMQSEAVEVSSISNTSAGNPLKYEYDTNSVTLVRFANGAIGKIGCSIECRQPYSFNIRLLGEEGSIVNNKFYSLNLSGQRDWAEIPTVLPDSGDVSEHPYQGEIDHFVECIRKGKESHVNLEDAVKTHEICLAAAVSAKTGKSVPLPLLKG